MKVLDKVLSVAKNPILRPVEVWALRAIVTFVCVKLGIDVAGVLNG